MERQLDTIEQWLSRIVCVIALIMVGFAHEVPSLASDPTNPATYDAYRLPDGTLPSLCVTLTEDGKSSPDHKAHNHGCEACRISASIILSAPADVGGSQVAYVAEAVLPLRPEAFHRQIYPPNTGPRAPPASTILI